MKRALFCGSLVLLAACSSRPVDEVRAEEAQGYRDEGDEALAAGNHARAIDLYTRALEVNPSAAETWWRRGNALVARPLDPAAPNRKRDWLRQAESDYSAATRLNPAFRDAFFNRAMVYLKMKRYKEAATDLLECTRLDPKDKDPEMILGEIYLKNLEDQQVRGMEHYDNYVKLGGDDPEVVKLVRDWRELKRAMAPPAPEAPRGPTNEDEAAARQIHARVLSLIPKGEEQRPEVAKLLEELTVKYAKTKYVRDNEKGLKALLNAFRAKEPEKK